MSNRKFSVVALGLCALVIGIVLLRSLSAGRDEHHTQESPDEFANRPTLALPPANELRSPVVQAAALPPASTALERAAAPAPTAALGEEQLMDALRNARSSVLAIRLARQGNEQFPDSEFAPERESLLIHALADNQQASEARGEAEYMVNHYPDSEWVREIERFTGAHPHRNVRLNEAGEIEYH